MDSVRRFVDLYYVIDRVIHTILSKRNRHNPSYGYTPRACKIIKSFLLIRAPTSHGTFYKMGNYLDSTLTRPNWVTNLKRAPIFEWCVVKCESMNKHQDVTRV